MSVLACYSIMIHKKIFFSKTFNKIKWLSFMNWWQRCKRHFLGNSNTLTATVRVGSLKAWTVDEMQLLTLQNVQVLPDDKRSNFGKKALS